MSNNKVPASVSDVSTVYTMPEEQCNRSGFTPTVSRGNSAIEPFGENASVSSADVDSSSLSGDFSARNESLMLGAPRERVTVVNEVVCPNLSKLVQRVARECQSCASVGRLQAQLDEQEEDNQDLRDELASLKTAQFCTRAFVFACVCVVIWSSLALMIFVLYTPELIELVMPYFTIMEEAHRFKELEIAEYEAHYDDRLPCSLMVFYPGSIYERLEWLQGNLTSCETNMRELGYDYAQLKASC